MMPRLTTTYLLALATSIATVLTACSDGSRPAGGGPDATVTDPTGAYARVTPGYETEAACRAANPDAGFNCVELLSLCADGRVAWLFTDIVFSGTWTARDSAVDVVMQSFEDGDGSFAFERRSDASLYSAEVYGDRAFAVTTTAFSNLCP
ncbi:MAG: hypothetical protein H0X17_00795 [Deltaproteobacteria bacterium]|nr:hypothetical protein [Deltaproteobacteria bacterium]